MIVVVIVNDIDGSGVGDHYVVYSLMLWIFFVFPSCLPIVHYNIAPFVVSASDDKPGDSSASPFYIRSASDGIRVAVLWCVGMYSR